MKYRVIWDNGREAAGEFLETFDTEEAAEAFGENWRGEMCAIDNLDPDDAGEDTYTFDVIEIKDPENDESEKAAAAEEQSLEYFNRYIAGDR